MTVIDVVGWTTGLGVFANIGTWFVVLRSVGNIGEWKGTVQRDIKSNTRRIDILEPTVRDLDRNFARHEGRDGRIDG